MNAYAPAPVLRAGAAVALVAPAGPMAEERIQVALQRCEQFGFQPVLGRAARGRRGFLAGSDAERLADLQEMLLRDDIDAIWALRGGYGTMRLLSALEPPRTPRAFIGFSDNTALHLWLLHHGFVSFHGPHAGGELPDFALDVFQRVLFDAAAPGVLPVPQGASPTTLQAGVAEGVLLGGNLALLAALCGTPWQPSARGRILFFEDVGEPGYRVDRLLQQLLLAGALEDVAGLAIGQFTDSGEPGEDEIVQEVLREFAAHIGVPAVSGFPIGHVADNWTLPQGVQAQLDADAGTLALLEPAVRQP